MKHLRTLSIRLTIVVVSVAFFRLESAKALIDIINTDITAVAYDVIDADVVEYYRDTAIPTSTNLDAVDGDSASINRIEWSQGAGQSVLLFIMNHARVGTKESMFFFSSHLLFRSNSDATYVLSGTYSVSNSSNESGITELSAYLVDRSTSVYLFDNVQSSYVTSNETFSLGNQDGDKFNALTMGSSLRGNLIAGHVYEFDFRAFNLEYVADDFGATAAGTIKLTIMDTNAMIPEPTSITMALLVGLVGTGIGSHRWRRRVLA